MNTEYQPIDTAPRDGTLVLAWMIRQKQHENDTERGMHVLAAFDTSIWQWVQCSPDGNGFEPHDYLTHWTPLPQPPKE